MSQGMEFNLTGQTGGQADQLIMAGIVDGNVGCAMTDTTSSTDSIVRRTPDLTNETTSNIGVSVNVTGITGGSGHQMNVIGVQNIRGQESDFLMKLEESTIEEAACWTEGMVRVASLDTVMTKLRAGLKWVTITGCPGEGKTTLGFMALKELNAQGHRVFNIETPEDYYKVKRKCRDCTIMLNDILGTFSFDQSLLRKWEKVIQSAVNSQTKAKETSKVIRVVFITRVNVLEVSKSHLGDLGNKVLDTTSTINLSTNTNIQDKLLILQTHLKKGQISISPEAMRDVAAGSSPHGFAHCCEIFSTLHTRHGQEVDIQKFFSHPLDFLDLTTKVLAERPNCLLLFKEMIVHDGKLDANTITDDAKRLQVKNVIKELLNSYLKKSREFVLFSHPSIYESIGQIVALKDDKYLIKNASLSFLQQTLNILETGKERLIGYINVELDPSLIDYLAEHFRPVILKKQFSLFMSRLCRSETFTDGLLKRTVASKGESEKISVDAKDARGETMLMWAAQDGNSVAVRVLLEHGADINVTDCTYRGNTTLHKLCQQRHLYHDCIQILLARGGSVNVLDHMGRSALHVLCQKYAGISERVPGKDIECLTLLLDHGADLNVRDLTFRTPLHTLCLQCRKEKKHNSRPFEFIKLLLARGADLNICNAYGETGLHILCSSDKPVILNMKLLLDSSSTVVNTRDCRGRTALHLLCSRNKQDLNCLNCIGLLIDRGVDINIRDENGWTALHHLCIKSQPDVKFITLLVNGGADINIGDKDGWTALHLLCSKEMPDFECMKLLIDSGAEPNLREYDRWTPLNRTLAVRNC